MHPRRAPPGHGGRARRGKRASIEAALGDPAPRRLVGGRAPRGTEAEMHMQRRTLLGLGGMTLTGAALSPAPARAQTPKRGGTLSLRLWDPPHFDPYLQV